MGTTFNCGFLGMLTILFIAFKLLHKIDWSWFWVLSPILIPLMIVGSVLFIILVIIIVGALLNEI